MIIGERLREARLEKGMTQLELGNLLGVSKVSVWGYETGMRTPTMKNFLDLIKILDLDPKYVLGQELKTINEDGEEYGVKIATVDLDILENLKKNPKVYNMLCNDIEKTVKIIEQVIEK